MAEQPVMIIEDNEFDLEITCHVFDRERVLNQLVVSRDGEEAFAYLFGQAGGAPPGAVPVIIVLDLNLPGIDGVEVLKRIRTDTRTAKVPVIVFTASEKDSDRQDCLDGGATEFVHKSGNHRLFIESVRKMMTDWLDVKPQTGRKEGNAD